MSIELSAVRSITIASIFCVSILLIASFSLCVLAYRAYPVYVNDYTTNGQQQYYAANESYSSSGNHQNETYIVPVDETILTAQSRESPQAISAVS